MRLALPAAARATRRLARAKATKRRPPRNAGKFGFAEAGVAVPERGLLRLVAPGRREGRRELAGEPRLLGAVVRGARLEVRRELPEAVARHLLHEDARVALGELAAVEEVEVLEARRAHERVGADLLLEAPGQVDGVLDGLDLGRRDGVRQLLVGHGARAQQGREPVLALVHEVLEERRGLVGLGEERLELGDARELGRRARPRDVGDRLVVRVGLGHVEELGPERERGLGDGDAARVQPLADHLEGLDALRLEHVAARGLVDVAVAVEQRGPRHAHVVEGDPGVVEVVARRLDAHVARRHARRREIHQERVGADALVVDGRVSQDDGLVRDVALGDPVLEGPLARRVEHELLRLLVVRRRRLDDEPGLHAREALRQREAAELAPGLDVGHGRDLLRPADGEHRAEAEVVVHREADPEPGALADRVAREEPVGLEEAVGPVAQVRVLEEAALDERAQGLARLRVVAVAAEGVRGFQERGLPLRLLVARGDGSGGEGRRGAGDNGGAQAPGLGQDAGEGGAQSHVLTELAET
jgi:hypothetical protein